LSLTFFCSENQEGTTSERFDSGLVALINDLLLKSLELDINGILIVVTGRLGTYTLAKFAHEDKLLEDAEVSAPLTIFSASVVHHVSEKVVIIILSRLL